MDVKVEVKIRLKAGMVDAEGETVAKALTLLSFPVTKVDSEKAYILTLEAESEDAAVKTVEEACKRLLANPVINDYTVEVV